MENIVKTETGTMIINGGNPLNGCPKDYDEAESWATASNKGKDEDYEPTWRFDCGFKLDFDGPILNIESRFYPPKTHYGPKWDGVVHLMFFNKVIAEKKIECDTLDELKTQVDAIVKHITMDLSLLKFQL